MYTPPLARLIEELQKLPSIGPKSAQRLAFHVLKRSEMDITHLADALTHAKANIRNCTVCYHLTSEAQCEICINPQRDQSVICVIAEPQDLFAFESTRAFQGLYHILNGLISPMEGVGPENIRVQELMQRLQASDTVKEIILALPPSVEGDTTSLYLSRQLQALERDIQVSRIAFGLPVGGDIEYADAMTLSRAIAGRTPV